MQIRLPPVTSGYELKVELLSVAIAWELFAEDFNTQMGHLDIDESQMELAKRVAEKTLAVLSDFTED